MITPDWLDGAWGWIYNKNPKADLLPSITTRPLAPSLGTLLAKAGRDVYGGGRVSQFKRRTRFKI